MKLSRFFFVITFVLLIAGAGIFFTAFFDSVNDKPFPTAFAVNQGADFFEDDFGDSSGIALQNNVDVSGGAVRPISSAGGEIDPNGPLGTGLIALFHLNDGAGPTISDSSGNGHTGTINGAVDCTIAGQFNTACNFNANNDEITFTNLSPPTSGTISFWVNTPFNEDSGAALDAQLINSTNDMLRFRFQGNAKRYLVYTNAVFRFQYIAGTDLIGWTHFLYTWDASSSVLYKNGFQVGSSTGDASIGQTSNIFIGSNGTNNDWVGGLDEFALWNRVLSPSEIATLAGGSSTSGDFDSINIASGNFNSLTATWIETNPGNTALEVSVDGGSTWCSMGNGGNLTGTTCQSQLPAASFSYRVNFSGATDLDNIRFDWVPTASSNQCTDNDGDGFGAQTTDLANCSGSTTIEDCNDSSGTVFPGAPEVCDNADNQCSGDIGFGQVDEGFTDETCQFTCQGNGFNWTGNGGSINCCGNDSLEASPFEATESSCSDSNDNDCDGSVDGADLDCSAPPANTIYVDGQLPLDCIGNYSIANRNCSGSDGDAYNELFEAANVVQAGDTVFVRGGTYVRSLSDGNPAGYPVLWIKANGTAANPITFKNYQNEKVIIDAQGVAQNGILVGWVDAYDKGDYVIVDGFEVTGTPRDDQITGTKYSFRGACANMEHAKNSVFRNIIVHHCGVHGIRIKGISDNSRVEFCESYENFWTGIIVTSNGGSNFGGSPANITVDNCYVHDNHGNNEGADGITINGAGSRGGHKVTNSIVYHNADDGIDTTATDNVLVENNIVFQQGDIGNELMFNLACPSNAPPPCAVDPVSGLCNTGCGDGGGIKVSTNAGGDHTIAYNIIFNNEGGAIDQDITVTAKRNYFYNNIGYGQNRGLVLDVGGSGTPQNSAVVYNNIFSNNSDQDFYPFGQQTGGTDIIQNSNYNFVKDGGVHLSQEGPNTIVNQDPGFPNPPTPRTSTLDPQLPLVVDTTPQGSLTATMDYIRAQVNAMFGVSSGMTIDAGTIIPGYHCDTADDDPLNPQSPSANCVHWFGTAPDMGAIEFAPNTCNGGTADGVCEAAENCFSDSIACTDNICFEPTCVNGCGEVLVSNGLTDESCFGNTGCVGGNCSCDGVGNCASSSFVVCGNGLIEGGEECDDGAIVDGDGCSSVCVVERNFSCSGQPSICVAGVCGNGLIEGGEECDDGGALNNDGCSSICAVENGFACSGEPSSCTADSPLTQPSTGEISPAGGGSGGGGGGGGAGEFCRKTMADQDGDCVTRDKDCNDFKKDVGQCSGCLVCLQGACVEGGECTHAVENVDSDGDGLTDRQETEIGTDPNLVDTDFDLISDSQEALDKTDPLNPNSNLLFVEFDKVLSAQSVQRIFLKHPTIGLFAGYTVELFFPSGQVQSIVAKPNGVAEFVVSEEGTNIFRLQNQSLKIEGEFVVRPKAVVSTAIETQAVEEILGEEASLNPAYFLLLIFSFLSLTLSSFVVLKNFLPLPVVVRAMLAPVYGIIPVVANLFLPPVILLLLIIIQFLGLLGLMVLEKTQDSRQPI